MSLLQCKFSSSSNVFNSPLPFAPSLINSLLMSLQYYKLGAEFPTYPKVSYLLFLSHETPLSLGVLVFRPIILEI